MGAVHTAVEFGLIGTFAAVTRRPPHLPAPSRVGWPLSLAWALGLLCGPLLIALGFLARRRPLTAVLIGAALYAADGCLLAVAVVLPASGPRPPWLKPEPKALFICAAVFAVVVFKSLLAGIEQRKMMIRSRERLATPTAF